MAIGDRLGVLRAAPQMIATAWSIAPRLLLTSCGLRVIATVVPIATLWISKEIVDGLARTKRNLLHLLVLVLAEFALVAVTEALQRLAGHVETLLSNRFTHTLNLRILEHAENLSLASFDNPMFQDRLERVRSQANVQLGVVFNAVQTFQTVAGLLASLFAVVLILPWFVGIQALAIIPVVVVEMHYAGIVYRMYRDRTPSRREMEYLLLLATSPFSAKEVKLFDFGKHLADTYGSLADRLFAEDSDLSSRRSLMSAATTVLSSVTYYACYGWLVFRAVGGSISIGSLLFLIGNFQRVRGHIQSLFSTLTRTVDQMTYLSDITEFFDPQHVESRSIRRLPAPTALRHGLEFRNVSFTYAGAALPSIKSLSFVVRPGEKIALVGENGAGKSTLVKLLTGLYEPTDGAVLLEGVDLREYDAVELRKLFSIVFQDFVRYDMSLRDNIRLGNIAAATQVLDIEFAAWKADAMSIADRLPKRYEQMLGRRFESGVDLSTGEWQKVALARAAIRDAQILVLDEPTASLDARAERAVFQQFSELTAGKMAVLISHRLATVRMVDRILVLEEGRLTEEGPHQELLRTGGEYAALFQMQASSYAEPKTMGLESKPGLIG